MAKIQDKRSIFNLGTLLLFGYLFGVLFVILGGQTILYYIGGLLLLCSVIFSFIFALAMFMLFWDIEKNKKGIIFKYIEKYNKIVDSIVGADSPNKNNRR